jgi:hypothetical protein
MMKVPSLAALLGCLLLPLGASEAQAEDVEVGVNLVNAPYNLSVAEQEAILTEMQRDGVRYIRSAIPLSDAGIAYAERVYAHGIKILLLGGVHYTGVAWPVPPAGFNGLWGSPGLSYADPERLRADVQAAFAKLEEKGIVLAGIEVGNEINWAGFNADFPLPGQGKVFVENDLKNDPEGQLIAKGLVLYVKSVAVVKEVRDHTQLNQHIPIISAGLADMDNGAHRITWIKADAVGPGAALNFMRANGLDDYVDAYSLHFYPTQGSTADRLLHLKQNGLEQCQPAGHKGGKPCWITEWGFNNTGVGDACPVDDSPRVAVVQEIRGQFNQLARQGRLRGLFYYTWQGNIRAPKEDRASAFRCGGLTASGRAAIAPM